MTAKGMPSEISAYSDDEAIWRYVDWPRLSHILLKSALFVPSWRVLRKDDPFEFSFPKVTYGRLVDTAIEVAKIIGEDSDEFSTNTHFRERSLYYASCWHKSMHESEAMWYLYGGQRKGIAIRSTVGRVKQLFLDSGASSEYSEDDRTLYCGNVMYRDYASDYVDSVYAEFFFHKRKSFEHEREFRFVIRSTERAGDGGIEIPISCLSDVVDLICIHPLAPNWQVETIKKLVEHSGNEIHAQRSSLDDSPPEGEAARPRCRRVSVSDDKLTVELFDGRSIALPLAWYPRLTHGTPEERQNWELSDRGNSIRWPKLDEDLSVEGLLAGGRSAESQASLQRWLAARKTVT